MTQEQMQAAVDSPEFAAWLKTENAESAMKRLSVFGASSPQATAMALWCMFKMTG